MISGFDTTSPKNWAEDFPHENGNYFNRCIRCDHDFIGHKRRVVCKECAYLSPEGQFAIKFNQANSDAYQNIVESKFRAYLGGLI